MKFKNIISVSNFAIVYKISTQNDKTFTITTDDLIKAALNYENVHLIYKKKILYNITNILI